MTSAKKMDPSSSKSAGSSEPLSFSSTLDSVCTEAERIKGELTLTVRDGNQFWFILPDGVLPNNPEAEVSISYIRFTAEGRQATMLTRMVFMRENGLVVDSASGKRILLEFRPCVLVGKSKEGKGTVHHDDQSGEKPAGVAVAKPKPAAPSPPSAAAEGAEVPDIGELLAKLQQTRKSVETIDALLADPGALLSEDEAKRLELEATIAQTKDRALIGLGELCDIMARGADQPAEQWRDSVSKSVATIIEAMVAFEDMGEHIQEGKRRELEGLRQAIEGYFATIDPQKDIAACKKFSQGINTIILTERKDTLNVVKRKIEKNVEKSYDQVISVLQQSMPKGSSVALVPHPFMVPAEGFYTKIVMNMIHVAMVVRFGGFSIVLDTGDYPKMFNELRAWDPIHPPRLHIVDRRRYASFREKTEQRGGRKG
ncbi:hypothetical protein WCLP8_4000007 [uncultured Gammaproteobacteria bacterium]